MDNMQLYCGDCLEVMSEMSDGSIDAVITDPPYGTTACKWDSVIPLKPMWEHLRRITKQKAAIVLTASQPFTSVLVASCFDMFKHEWIWKKNRGSNFASLKSNPFKEHESVIVFSQGVVIFNPIREERSKSGKARAQYDFQDNGGGEAIGIIRGHGLRRTIEKDKRHPSSVQKFNCEVGLHPTQKPVALMKYLIETYTNESETVLDFAMGSGTTGVACMETNRKFVGIEKDSSYFEEAKRRIETHKTKVPSS